MHVIDSLGPGGAERSLSELLPMYQRAGIENKVICLQHRTNGVHEVVEQLGIDVDVIGASRWTAVPRLRGAIRAWKPQIVHTSLFEADVWTRLAAWREPCRVVTSLVTPTYDAARTADRSISISRFHAARLLDGVTARHLTDHFHAVSPQVKNSAIRHLGIRPERVTVVGRGRNPDRLGSPSPRRRKAARAKLGLSDSAEIVLNTARHEPPKGLPILLEAVAKLAPRRPQLILVNAGREGKATPDLKRLTAHLGLESQVRFLGHREDIGDLLAAADVFAFPSLFEGLPGSVLEAMALRVPMVVSDIPPLVDVTESGRGAVVVPVNDPTATAAAIEKLLDERREASRLAEEAYQIFMSRFTLDHSAEGMLGIYRDVLADRRIN